MDKRTIFLLTLSVFLFALVVPGRASDASDGKDYDNYRWRIEGNWWFSHPSGYFGARSSNSYIDINKDFGFGSYSTFAGRVDYRFKHKHHLLFTITPISNSRTVTLNRTIDFQGQTYDLGATVAASVKSLNFAPGYQYDIIRRDRLILGLEVDVNLLDTKAELNTVKTANSQSKTTSSSKSFFAPLPALGPIFRWYPLPNSNRLSLEGSFRGMSFFGYGNFLSTRANFGVGITQHLSFRGGYQLGSRLSVHGTSDQIAIQLTQKGPTAGLEYSWGEAPPPKPPKPPSTEPSPWHVDWVPFYLWFSGLSGNVGAAGYVAPVSVSFSQVFQQLNIGLMTDLDVRRKRIGLTTDFIFMSLTTDQKSTPVGKAFSGFTANAKEVILQPELYYRVLERDQFTADAEVGTRIWRLDNSLSFLQGSLPATDVGQTKSWADPTVGARFGLKLPKNCFATIKGDAGGFGVNSSLAWQIYGGVGKSFKQKYSAMLGYRYLYEDYKNGGFLYNVHMQGLVLGFGIHFK